MDTPFPPEIIHDWVVTWQSIECVQPCNGGCSDDPHRYVSLAAVAERAGERWTTGIRLNADDLERGHALARGREILLSRLADALMETK